MLCRESSTRTWPDDFSPLVIAFILCGEAARALLRNKVRTALTALSITIGIAAVVWVVALGKAGAQRAEEQLQSLGDNLVWVEAGSRNVAGVRTGTHGMTTLTPRTRKPSSTRSRTSRACLRRWMGACSSSMAAATGRHGIAAWRLLTWRSGAFRWPPGAPSPNRRWRARPACASSARRCASSSSAPKIPSGRRCGLASSSSG